MKILPGFSDYTDPMWVTWKMMDNTNAIRGLMEETRLTVQPAQGPAEFHVDIDLEQLADAQHEAAYENSLHMEQMREDQQTTNLVLTDIRDYLRTDLTRAAAEQFERLQDIQDAMGSLSENLSERLQDIQDAMGSLSENLFELDARAADRHEEMLRTARSKYGNQANERYQSAWLHFKTGEMSQASDQLKMVFKKVSTHPPGWILSGLIYQRCGRADLARQAFAKAASYAYHGGQADEHAAAVIAAVQLERTVRNYSGAAQILQVALAAVGETGKHYAQFSYEAVEMLLEDPTCTGTPEELASALEENVLNKRPDFLDKIAASPKWEEVLKVRPFWRFGNAPYRQLMEGLHRLKVHLADGRYWPVLVAGETTYDELFQVLQGGTIAHPHQLSYALEQLQGIVVRGGDPVIEASLYFPWLEQIALYVSQQYPALDPRSGRVYDVVQRPIRLWEGAAGEGTLFPNLWLPIMKAALAGPDCSKYLFNFLDRVLPNVVRAYPEIRNRIARDPEFQICRDIRRWTKLGNSPTAPLLEAIDGIVSRGKRFEYDVRLATGAGNHINDGKLVDEATKNYLIGVYRQTFGLVGAPSALLLSPDPSFPLPPFPGLWSVLLDALVHD